MLTLIDDAAGQIVGADIVELNPGRDVSGVTAEVAAKLVKDSPPAAFARHKMSRR